MNMPSATVVQFVDRRTSMKNPLRLITAALLFAVTVGASATANAQVSDHNYWITLTNNTPYLVTIYDIENSARYGTGHDDGTVTDRIDGTIEAGKSKMGRIRMLDVAYYTEVWFKASYSYEDRDTKKTNTPVCMFGITYKTSTGEFVSASASRYDGDPLPKCSVTGNGFDRYYFNIETSNDHPSPN